MKKPAGEPAVHVRETGERTLRTYNALYVSARQSLKIAKDTPVGSSYFLMSAGVFAAFTAEANFNDLGPRVLKFWKHLERLAPREKAEVLAMQLLDRPIDWGRRPFQSLGEAFDFRDRLAHGRTETVTYDEIRVVKAGGTTERDPFSDPALQTGWEKTSEIGTIERFVNDARAAIEMLCEAHKPGQVAFGMMSSFISGQQLLTRAEAEQHQLAQSKKQKPRGRRRAKKGGA